MLAVLALSIIGMALVIGPWLLRLSQDLRHERQERVRSQERADMAAHLHDSVLQTLALIQRQAHDASVVSQLARTQEREPRTWLFERTDAEGATPRPPSRPPQPRSRTTCGCGSKWLSSATSMSTTASDRWLPPPGRRW